MGVVGEGVVQLFPAQAEGPRQLWQQAGRRADVAPFPLVDGGGPDVQDTPEFDAVQSRREPGPREEGGVRRRRTTGPSGGWAGQYRHRVDRLPEDRCNRLEVSRIRTTSPFPALVAGGMHAQTARRRGQAQAGTRAPFMQARPQRTSASDLECAVRHDTHSPGPIYWGMDGVRSSWAVGAVRAIVLTSRTSRYRTSPRATLS
jgi:hypothetical protein